MQHSWIAILAGLPLIIGAGLPPERPIPQAQHSAVPAGVVEVNFLTRLLQDGESRNRAPRRRASPKSQARGPAPEPPAPANVPIPIPKPAAGEAEKPAEAPRQADSSAKPVVQEPPRPEAPPPVAQLPVAQNRQNENPQGPSLSPAQSPPPSPPVVEQPGTASEPAHEAEVPKPQPKPGTTAADVQPADKPGQPAAPGQDVAKPDDAKPNETKPDEQKAEAPPPPPLVKEDPEELKACLAELTSLGTKFEPTDPIDDGNGCGIESPIDVAEVLPGVSLGSATMRCKTAVSMAHWLKDTVQPALNIAMPGRRITGIVPGSTYACRLRNSASTGKISEHARGNAFDVAAFKLDNGEKMEMKPRTEDSTMEGAFQRTATAGACLHFTTVLSAGSDAAHQNHLHLDVLERKDGYRYCR
ncbi:extensin family protein [Neorhizobium galegae]|uniref:extensin family protein n=1 Tax=Neorhizobium galegae TaxID=399 RepID=UPI002100B7D5|nr:extensin family protein [Neorhizobium galegae]